MVVVEFTRLNIKWRNTGTVCPEQWEGYEDGKCVGYLRLRFGHLKVCLYDGETMGDTVLEMSYGHEFEGSFVDEESRRAALTLASYAIQAHRFQQRDKEECKNLREEFGRVTR